MSFLPLMVCLTVVAPENASASDDLFEDIKPMAQSIPAERQEILSKLATAISTSIQDEGTANITFICTHNSRRSQFSQAWLHAAAEQVGLSDKIQAFSGGTEATACNPRTVAALSRAGFGFDVTNSNDTNPKYSLIQPKSKKPLTMFSKVYDKSPNPDSNFIAVMCCGDANERCPVVAGASERIALLYVDPKVSDGTSKESETYDERCRQIGSEMYFIMKKVADQLANK
ncbi:MAG: protein-tyrosine-phosphatase [Planctomycetota bacterium]